MEPIKRPVRIGFLVPPGNPTVEVEMIALAPPQVSVHFTRMVAPKVIVLAHAATSYTLGKAGEAELVARMQRDTGIPFVTAFGSVLAALAQLKVKRIAYGTPYDAGA